MKQLIIIFHFLLKFKTDANKTEKFQNFTPNKTYGTTVLEKTVKLTKQFICCEIVFS